MKTFMKTPARRRIGFGLFAAFTFMMTRPVLAAADSSRGKTLYESLCIACHSIDYNGVGPAHRGVFDRQAGSSPNYAYSPALKNSRIAWTAENLDQWLAGPEKLVPGQKMGFAVDSAQDRADLIAYLKTLSPSP